MESDMNFNEVKTRNELADFLGIKRSTLSYVLYKKKTENYYISFEIPKKSGGERKIDAPVGTLKSIQKKLADKLYRYQEKIRAENKIIPKISNAFEKGKNIITNAEIHRNKRFVLNIDLKDFFHSFHFGRVRGFFLKNKHFQLTNEVSTVLAQLSCFEGRLPQGAATSPILANMIFQIVDMRILKIAKRYHCDYTRYADDLTFSTNKKKFAENYIDLFNTLKKEIERSGFSINEDKTNLMYKDSRQVVTGLVVNEKVSIIHTYYRKARSMANHLYKTGEFYIDGNKGSLKQLDGIFSFINQIDNHNKYAELKLKNQYNRSKQLFRNLNGREKQYQLFLFYKYFYANETPLIITEGKTDIRYIKAALKSLYSNFPGLILKNQTDDFEFKISFFHRTKRLQYFFGIDIDGADTNTDFIENFLHKKKQGGLPDHYSDLEKWSGNPPKNPVIFIYDNELNSSEKTPIKNLITRTGVDKEALKENGYVKICRNVFVVIIPLVSGKKVCEIEDLFFEETLQTPIDGRTFQKKVKKGDKYHYSKDVFSKYVYRNYRDINFNNFNKLLNILQTVINEYRKCSGSH